MTIGSRISGAITSLFGEPPAPIQEDREGTPMGTGMITATMAEIYRDGRIDLAAKEQALLELRDQLRLVREMHADVAELVKMPGWAKATDAHRQWLQRLQSMEHGLIASDPSRCFVNAIIIDVLLSFFDGTEADADQFKQADAAYGKTMADHLRDHPEPERQNWSTVR